MPTYNAVNDTRKILLNGSGILKNESIENISYFSAFEGISEVKLMDKRAYTLGMTMAELEASLPELFFFRCSRSHIINLLKVYKITFNHECNIIMECGAIIRLSRRRKVGFTLAMNKLLKSHVQNAYNFN
jgi:DNA-binding LytR/AlgR family response regulator